MNNLFDTIATFDNVAKSNAFRSIANSCLAQAIGQIRQSIRDRINGERKDDADTQTGTTDQRTEDDENARADADEASMSEFGEKRTALQLAGEFMALRNVAILDGQTISTKKWDMAMTPKGMLDFMLKKTPDLAPEFVNAMVKASKGKLKPAQVLQMAELQAIQDRQALERDMPEIIATLAGLDNEGYDDCIEQLPVVNQYKLAVKVWQKLQQAKDKIPFVALKTRSIAAFADEPLLQAAQDDLGLYINEFEERNRDELQAAHDNGMTLPSIEDSI